MRARWGAVVAVVLVGSAGAHAAPVCTDQLAGINERCPSWVGAYNHTGRGGRGEDIGRDLAVSPDGASVYITGQSRDDASGDDQAVVAYDAATGAQRWVARTTSDGSSFDTGSSVTTSPDGARVFAAGRSIGPNGDWDWITSAYHAGTGQRLWTTRYATEGSDRTWGVATSPDGVSVYVVGESNGGDIGIAAYEAATGEQLWTGSYDGGAYDWALDIRVAPDGQTVYAAGTSIASTTSTDLAVIAFRTSSEGAQAPGTTRWVSLSDGGVGSAETYAGFDLSDDGTMIALGGFTMPVLDKALTVLLDASTGAERWRGVTEGSAADTDVRDSVAIGGNRVARVVRLSGGTGVNSEFRTVTYDATTGTPGWVAMIGSPEPTYKDHGKTVAFSPDGSRLFVSGYSVLPYGQTGQTYTEPGHILTVSYDAATGVRRWVARHNQSGVGADFGVSLVPSPDGQRVFIGGTFILVGTRIWASDLTMAYAYDFGVVAYNA